MKLQLQIFIAFFRVGLLGFGGGPSSIPLVYKEVVDTYKWMDDEQFSNILALGNTLPGPIITKMAGYIGYRVGGITGMLVSLAASVLPTILLMLVLLAFFQQYKDHRSVQGMAEAVIPIVGVMMAVLTWNFFKKAKDGLGWTKSVLLFVASLVLLVGLHIHPGLLVALLLILALVLPVRTNETNDTKGKVKSK